MKPQSRFIVLFLLIVVVALGIGGGVYVYIQNKQASQSVADKVVSTTQTPSSTRARWETYKNTQYGFEMQYPPSWVATSSSRNILSVTNTTHPTQGLVLDGRLQMSTPLNLETLPPSSKNQFSADLNKNANFTIGDEKAVRKVQKNNQGIYAEYIWFLHGNKYFGLTLTWAFSGNAGEIGNYGNKDDILKTFNQMLATFKFTK